TGTVWRLEMFTHAQFARWIDSPREFDPELIFLPDLSGIRLMSKVDLLTRSLAQDSMHRLPERNPLRRMCLLAHQVVTFRAQSHRQHVVRKPCRLTPYRSERGVQLNLRLIAKHFHPTHAVWIRPNRVVYSREVSRQVSPVILEKMRKQKTHL